MNESEQLEEAARPTRAEAITRSADPARIQFDWVPAVVDGCVTFHISITRGERHSSSKFDVDLNSLNSSQAERLYHFLALRHAGVTSALDVTLAAAWLLDVWLSQTQPASSKLDRDAMVKTILLAQTTPNERTL
jgi:hypothetical protein